MRFGVLMGAIVFTAAGCDDSPQPVIDCTTVTGACETEGQAQCSDDAASIETCAPDEDACLVWTAEACGAAMHCDAEGEAPGCVEDVVVPVPEIDWLEAGAPPVAAPEVAWLEDGQPPPPVFECPAGWRAVEGPLGSTVCDPWPETGREDCEADDEVHLPGEPRCRPVGSPCTGDGWPADLPATGVWYVDDDAAAGGDGTLATPFATVPEAIAAAAAGDTIAIAAGRYDGSIVVNKAVRLVGACAAETVLTRSDADPAGVVVVVSAEGVTIADLAVADAATGGIAVLNNAGLAVRGVAVARVVNYGIATTDGADALTLDDFVIRDVTRVATADIHWAYGVAAPIPTTVTRGAVIRAQTAFSLRRATAADLSSLDTPIGFEFWSSSSAARVVVEGGRTGLWAYADEVVLEDVVVSRTSEVGIQAGAMRVELTVTLRRALIDDAVGVGLLAAVDAVLDAQQVVVTGTSAGAGEYGMGVRVLTGGAVNLTDAVIEGSESVGIYADGATASASNTVVTGSGYAGVASLTDGSVTLTDVAVLDTPPEAASQSFGVVAQERSTVSLERVLVARTHSVGIAITEAGEAPTSTLTDVVVEESLPQANDTLGVGVLVRGGSAALSRVSIDGAHGAALTVGTASTVTAEDFSIANVSSQVSDGVCGDGVEVYGGTLTMERAVIDAVQASGLSAFELSDVAPDVTLTDVAVRGVTPMSCAVSGGCPGLDSATGLYLQVGSMTVSRVLVEGAVAGLQCSGGTMTVTDAVVRDGAVGVNEQGCAPSLTRVDLTGADAPESTDALAVPVP